MKYKLFGKSGLRVSELCLGTMTFGGDWGYGADKDECQKMFDVFTKAGGNFIDTANRYTEGTSEKFIGDFIAYERSRFVVATKYSLYDRMHDVNASGNHRKNLVQSLEGSLKRLKTDYVDILYLHAWDFTTPAEEVLRALDDMVRSGKVFYIAISNTPAWVISMSNAIADLRGWKSFAGVQVEYNLLQRTPEREFLPMAKQQDLAVIAWAPIAGGALTGKYLGGGGEGNRLKPESIRLNARSQEIVAKAREIAEEAGCSTGQVALNWLRQKNQVVIPVIGARKENQMRENMACLNFKLTVDQIKRLDEASKIELGYPYDFLSQEGVRNNMFGGMRHALEIHREK